MNPIYNRLQKITLKIASRYPEPDFYSDFQQEVSRSENFFSTDPIVTRLKRQVEDLIENDFGHGLAHVTKVALDAGAVILIEGMRRNWPEKKIEHFMRLVQCAGLLHDIMRKEKNHAIKGAAAAEKILADYPFAPGDITCISNAIRNHEAFGVRAKTGSEADDLVSDSLYDSDKFRFGPENFTHTVWDMIRLMDIPLSKFLSLFPKGMAFLERIKATFRTETGKEYGPQFIEIGLSIGNELFAYIEKEGLAQSCKPSGSPEIAGNK